MSVVCILLVPNILLVLTTVHFPLDISSGPNIVQCFQFDLSVVAPFIILDVNECAQSFGPCMHLCTNTPGSFRCLCQNGFKPLANGSCEAQGNLWHVFSDFTININYTQIQ